jgi:hypothetical protein
VGAAQRRNSSAAFSGVSAMPIGCFSRASPCHEDQHPWGHCRRLAGDLDPSSGLRSGLQAPRTHSFALEDGGSCLHRGAASLYGAIAAEQNGWLAAARDPVVGAALCVTSPEALPSLDRVRAGCDTCRTSKGETGRTTYPLSSARRRFFPNQRTSAFLKRPGPPANVNRRSARPAAT